MRMTPELERESVRSLYNLSPDGYECGGATALSMADRLETMYAGGGGVVGMPPAILPPSHKLDCPPPKKRKVNFSLTLDIKQEEQQQQQAADDACVPVAAAANAAGSGGGDNHSDVESYYSDLPAFPTTPHGGPQVPPLTPGTNLKVGEALKATYASWNDKTRHLGIPRDPRAWENIEVIAWLDWAANEFQLYSDTVTNFIRNFKVISIAFFPPNVHRFLLYPSFSVYKPCFLRLVYLIFKGTTLSVKDQLIDSVPERDSIIGSAIANNLL